MKATRVTTLLALLLMAGGVTMQGQEYYDLEEIFVTDEIQVYNALGQLVKVVRGTNEVNVSGLSEGLYLLRITDTYGEEHSVRIVVKE